MSIVFKLALLGVVLVALSSCGVRGALYLPEDAKKQEAPQDKE